MANTPKTAEETGTNTRSVPALQPHSSACRFSFVDHSTTLRFAVPGLEALDPRQLDLAALTALACEALAESLYPNVSLTYAFSEAWLDVVEVRLTCLNPADHADINDANLHAAAIGLLNVAVTNAIEATKTARGAVSLVEEMCNLPHIIAMQADAVSVTNYIGPFPNRTAAEEAVLRYFGDAESMAADTTWGVYLLADIESLTRRSHRADHTA